jgi:hypothetical protein
MHRSNAWSKMPRWSSGSYVLSLIASNFILNHQLLHARGRYNLQCPTASRLATFRTPSGATTARPSSVCISRKEESWRKQMESSSSWESITTFMLGMYIIASMPHELKPTSKSQYETQFRKWKIRKNLTKPGWKRIIQYLNQNVLNLEHCEIVFQGVVLPKDRVSREIARYGHAIEEEGTSTQDLFLSPVDVVESPAIFHMVWSYNQSRTPYTSWM